MRRFYAIIWGLCFSLFVFTSAAFAEESLKMAVFPRKPPLETSAAFDPLAKYLSSKIGKKVELVVFKDFESFWGALQKEKFDLVHYNQYQYIKSHKELGYRVVLMNEEFGEAKAKAAIIVRSDSGINTLSDLKGKRIIFGGGKQAMQSYIGATQILRKGGLKKGDYQEEFAINPTNGVISVYKKLADASGVGEMLLGTTSMKDRIDVSQLKVLERGEPLPMLCWAVRPGLDDPITDRIVKVMTSLKQDDASREILKKIEATTFLPASDSDYDVVRKVVKEVLGEEY
jgi:phosphonate transport system substrate-binding protein